MPGSSSDTGYGPVSVDEPVLPSPRCLWCARAGFQYDGSLRVVACSRHREDGTALCAAWYRRRGRWQGTTPRYSFEWSRLLVVLEALPVPREGLDGFLLFE